MAIAAFGPGESILHRGDLDSSWLSASELARAERMRRPVDRRSFVAAHLLARGLVAEHLGCEPEDVVIRQRCDRCGGDHGRPSVVDEPGTGLSMSHSGRWVAVAVAEGAVGVDVEAGDGPHVGPRAELLHPAEREAVRVGGGAAFRRQWTRRECLVKLGRLSLDEVGALDLSGLPVSAPTGGGGRVRRHDDLLLIDAVDPGSATTICVAVEAIGQVPQLRAVDDDGCYVDLPITDLGLVLVSGGEGRR